MAKNLKSKQVFHLLCTFLLVFFVLSVNVLSDINDDQRAVTPEGKTKAFWMLKIKQSGKDYWAKLKESFAHGHSYFFPPSIDFSGKDDVAGMGAGDKIKEAAAKSFEKSKETVEETARSAAEAVGDAAGAVKEKVKKSVSSKESTKSEESTSEL